MQLVSVNIGAVSTLVFQGREHVTGFIKTPVDHRVQIADNRVAGDHVMDRKHHGGIFKAVYSYAAEHYDYWHAELDEDLPYGSFGENLNTEGLDEAGVYIGDQFRIGTVILEAVQPRFPCGTLGAKFRDKKMIPRFLDSGRLGIYYRIIEEGELGAGDAIECIYRHPGQVLLSEITRLHFSDKEDEAALARIIAIESLPPEWRTRFSKQLAAV